MGGETKSPKTLVDFLYKDISRINSLLSQLLPGVLTEVATASEHTRVDSYQAGANVHFIGGDIAGEKSSASAWAKRYDPYDQVILDLLEALEMEPFSGSLDTAQQSQLMLLKGTVSIRNFETLKTAIPKLSKANLLGINKKDAKALESVLSLMPMGLEMDIYTVQKETVIGTLEPDFLTIRPDDLLRLYGNYIPGEWFMLGIIDSIVNLKSGRTGTPFSDLRLSLDQYGEAIQKMYNENYAKYAMIPLLIFREIAV